MGRVSKRPVGSKEWTELAVGGSNSRPGAVQAICAAHQRQGRGEETAVGLI